MDDMIFQVPRFAQKFKTCGLFSEQNQESIHNIINHELRRYASVRDSNLKMLLLLQNQASRKFVDKHKFLPLPRNKTQ